MCASGFAIYRDTPTEVLCLGLVQILRLIHMRRTDNDYGQCDAVYREYDTNRFCKRESIGSI